MCTYRAMKTLTSPSLSLLRGLFVFGLLLLLRGLPSPEKKGRS